MPVRDLDAFLTAGDAPVRCLRLERVNGIDGIVSSALGALQPRSGRWSWATSRSRAPTSMRSSRAAITTCRDPSRGHRQRRRRHALVPSAGMAQRPSRRGYPSISRSCWDTPAGVLPWHRLVSTEFHQLDPVVVEPVAVAPGASGCWVLRLRTDRARNVVLRRSRCQDVGDSGPFPLTRLTMADGRFGSSVSVEGSGRPCCCCTGSRQARRLDACRAGRDRRTKSRWTCWGR